MGVPGSNILNRALKLLIPQSFSYYAYTGRAKTVNGLLRPTYADAVSLTGSVQPVPRRLYAEYGLDFQKNYTTFFVSKNIIDVARDVAGDQFSYASRRYNAISRTDWFAQDGWDAILAIEVTVPTPPTPEPVPEPEPEPTPEGP